MAMTNQFVYVLYGSRAADRADISSDTDVLVIANGQPPHCDAVPVESTVSSYTWQEFTAMRDVGSPFLTHLQLEGQVLGGDPQGIAHYEQLLLNLPRYGRAADDLASFAAALQDVSSAIKYRDSTPDFEAASVATVIRHASILGCYLLRSPDFGRYSPVAKFVERRELEAELATEFPYLYSFRMALARSLEPAQAITYECVEGWSTRAYALLEEVSNVTD